MQSSNNLNNKMVWLNIVIATLAHVQCHPYFLNGARLIFAVAEHVLEKCCFPQLNVFNILEFYFQLFV